MSTEIVMPRLSDSMEEGTVLQWIKKLGDQVAIGDELVEIETDKANMIYEADVAGKLTRILAEEGTTMPIGEVIAYVGGAEDEVETTDAPAQAPAEPGAAATAFESAVTSPGSETGSPAAPVAASGGEAPAGASSNDGRVKASPLARRIAGETGVDLASISGSGPGGRIVKADLAAAGTGSASGAGTSALVPAIRSMPAVGDGETAKGQTVIQELTKLQSTVARRMSESKATAPHFYLTTEIDMSRAFEARARVKASAPEGAVIPSFNDMIVKACAIALKEFPRANGAYRDGHWELYSRINIGIAVAASDALVVPTVFDADRKGLAEIATESRHLAERVRDGKITPPELSGGTFTVSNLGMFGVTSFQAVINSPQAAILAVGSIEDRVVVRSGQMVPGKMMAVNIASDHRILYGADSARFLARIRALLEEPLSLAL